MYWFVNIEKVFLGSLIALSKSLHHCFLLENNYDFAEKRGDYLDKTGKKAGLKKAREAWNMLAWTQEWFNQTPEKVENRSCYPFCRVERFVTFLFGFLVARILSDGSHFFRSDWVQKIFRKTAVINTFLKNMHFMNLTFRMLVNIHFQKYDR